MGYGSITFKNFAIDLQQSDYNGYFWTQVGDKTFKGSTNGLWKKEENLHLRISNAEKIKYNKVADDIGLSLSAFARYSMAKASRLIKNDEDEIV